MAQYTLNLPPSSTPHRLLKKISGHRGRSQFLEIGNTEPNEATSRKTKPLSVLLARYQYRFQPISRQCRATASQQHKLSKNRTINMFDDPLTVTHELESKLLGRAQGLYGVASQGESALMMAMNFVFTTGKYNGSTLTILGWNPIFRKVREMPVIGGSGLFRFARGYVHASTYSFDLKTGDSMVEYNVHVLHY